MDKEQVKKATGASTSQFARRRRRDAMTHAAWPELRPQVPKRAHGAVGNLGLSVLLVAVWVMDELPVDVLGLLRVELLPAVGALDLPVGLDADVDGGAVARLGGVADLHGFGHPSVTEAALRRRQHAGR